MDSSTGAPVIMLIGANGQVGWALKRTLQGLGRVVALERRALDLSMPERVVQVVRSIKPDLIVNAAAYTAVDQAEAEPDLALRVNTQAPGVLALEAKRTGAALIHYSTDYVFDGMKPGPYVESDPAHPLNEYGRSKLGGERAIEASNCHHVILRTSWVYGMRGRNFLRTMLRLAGERDELAVVADQIGAPTWDVTIAAVTAHIAAQGFAATDRDAWWAARSGLYHMTASGRASWFDFATEIVAAAGKPTRVKAISSADYPTRALRPKNSCLDCSKLRQAFGIYMPDWKAALNDCVEGKLKEICDT